MWDRTVRSIARTSVCVAGIALSFLTQASRAQTTACDPPPETITIQLPLVVEPPDDEEEGWERPDVWEHHPDAFDDEITIPNGRPIYALIVSGFGQNKYLDEIMVYRFVRFLQTKGAYVHYSWWNNLLAPYMARPLHHDQSEPGGIAGGGILNFTTAEQAGHKAVPAEDYQFVADAELMLSAIREHNPSAMIIVVGHSMGGGAVVHLGSKTDVLIDILAPIDPVGNRNYPWAGTADTGNKDFNWTRWRVTRDNFLGYQKLVHEEGHCVAVGPWLKDRTDTNNDPLCSVFGAPHDADEITFGPNIINLYHRWQKEAVFPFDFLKDYEFEHDKPTNGTTIQESVATKFAFDGLLRTPDEGGWPLLGKKNKACCTSGDNGVGWDSDGHGEIVGHRGPVPPVPLGVRLRTSPQCGKKCDDLDWPARELSDGEWSNGDSTFRANLLKNLETKPKNHDWKHAPTNPDLCMVSSGLISKFKSMNKPPKADAGEDQTVECTGSETPVMLNGLASNDPDGTDDVLEYKWTWSTDTASGPVAIAHFARGTHCITLDVRDESGHIDRDTLTVTVEDTTPPQLDVTFTPQLLWPPNHHMVDINAIVDAQDVCGGEVDVTLVSIVSNQPDNGTGDGDTINDIQDADYNTGDLTFKLRAERAGNIAGDRHYTVTYQATDDAGNQTQVSVDVIVPHDAESLAAWEELLE
ncbi:MAG: alpha/beta hydrolase [Phycisphaerales bacterium]|nr:alpha/beta hydrolase [Phycisphaerales bacterium]